jgi:tRNA 2-thiouridine synthesizing protein A
VLATDPAAVIDMPHFCRESGNLLLAVDALPEGVHAYVIRRS